MRKKYFIEIICALYIVLFVYAAGNKFVEFDKFRVQLGQSPLITAYADWLVWIVPLVEIVIACMLAMPRFRLAALYAAYSLMLMFSAYIVAILNFSFYVPCSCGGVLSQLGWTEHLVFNIVFVLMALAAIVFESQEEESVVKESVGVPA